MEKCSASKIPFNKESLTNDNENSGQKYPYREAIGTLQYLSTCTRPDIAFAVNYLSRFLENPTLSHWRAILKLLKYIQGTQHLAIYYEVNAENEDSAENDVDMKIEVSAEKEDSAELEGYSDADFANDEDRKSISGICVKYKGCIVSWKSKKQPIVALSSTEAELIASTEVVKQIIWLNKIISELTGKISVPTIYVDNLSTIRLIKNNEGLKKTKHVEIRFLYIRQLYQEGKIKVSFVRSKYQLADLLCQAAVGFNEH